MNTRLAKVLMVVCSLLILLPLIACSQPAAPAAPASEAKSAAPSAPAPEAKPAAPAPAAAESKPAAPAPATPQSKATAPAAPAAESKPAAAAKPETLTVGLIVPMNNPWGVEADKSYQALIEKLNASGGLDVQGRKYNLKLITYDDKYTTDAGKAAAERLVYQDNVKIIIGPFASSALLGIVPVTEKEKVLLIHSGSSDQLFNPDYRYSFRALPAKASQTSMMQFAVKFNPNIKTYNSLATDDAFGRFQADGFTKIGNIFGVSPVGDLFFKPDTTDFTDLATKVKSVNPDLVFWAGSTGTTLGLVRKSLYNAGWRGTFMSGSQPIISEVQSVASSAAMDGYVYQTRDLTVFPAGQAKDLPAALELRKVYESKYGTWNGTGAMWVNPYFELLAAIKKANSVDPAAIVKTLESASLSFDAPMGKVSTITRPDMKIKRYVDTISEANFGVFKDMKENYAGTLTIEEVVGGMEKAFGFKGEW